MAYGNVPSELPGNIAQSARYNQLVSNVDDLDTRLDVTEALTTNTSGNVGTGNQRLSDRLGAGVTNASTATSQFGTVNASIATTNGNVTTLQNQVGAAPTSPNLHSRVSTLESASTVSPIVRVVRATNQTISHNQTTWQAVSWSSAPRNPNTIWSGANPTRLTVPSGQGGLYMINGIVLFAPNATGYRAVAAKVNNGSQFRAGTLLNAGGNYTEMIFTIHLELAAADYVEIVCWQNSGGNLDVQAVDGTPNVVMRKVAT